MSVVESIRDLVFIEEVNVFGMFNIIKVFFEGYGKLIFVFFVVVYGDNFNFLLKEIERFRLFFFYGVIKVIVEEYFCVFYEFYGLLVVFFCYFNVFGLR